MVSEAVVCIFVAGAFVGGWLLGWAYGVVSTDREDWTDE